MMPEKSTNFTTLSKQLDEILAKLQSADLDVDDAIKEYERGIEIAIELEKYLKTAENKVNKIKINWESKIKKS